MWRAGLVLVLVLGGGGCAGTHDGLTRVFVRDPRQVWVAGETTEGERVVLPAGGGMRGVTLLPDLPPRPSRPGDIELTSPTPLAVASLFREPEGGITIDHPACAPWATNPLSSRGELKVPRVRGERAFRSDGKTLRIPFRCETGDLRVIELTFVTPVANVKEVHVMDDAPDDPIATGSSDPALQAHPWERQP